MARLRQDFIERLDSFSDRVLDEVAALPRRSCAAFVRDQLGRNGTSVGSNVNEANHAISIAEFRSELSISLRELGETKFWLRMIGRRGWLKPSRLAGLADEAEQITRILATLVAKTDPGRGDSATGND